jgi:hypothetical protein
MPGKTEEVKTEEIKTDEIKTEDQKDKFKTDEPKNEEKNDTGENKTNKKETEDKTVNEKTENEKTENEKTENEKTEARKTGERKTEARKTGKWKTELSKIEEEKTEASTNRVSIMHGNIQCLRNKVGQLEVALSSLMPDILCLTEHWLRDQELDSATVEGYSFENAFCRKQYKNGGVIIYAKKGTIVTPKRTFDYLNAEKVFEATAIDYECPQIGKIIVICVYRSPGSDLKIFLDKMDLLLSKLTTVKTNMLVCGDFNVNFNMRGTDTMSLLDLFSAYDLKKHIDGPTRISRTSSTCIDNIFSNITIEHQPVSEVMDLGLSDHHFQILTIKINRLHATDRVIKKRIINESNVDRFAKDMSRVRWDSIDPSKPVDEMFEEFVRIFLLIFNKSFPIKEIKVGLNRKARKGNWYTPRLQELGEKVIQAYTKYRQLDEVGLEEKYNSLIGPYRSEINAAKRARNDQFIRKSKNKAKAGWNIIKENSNRSNITTQDIQLENPTDNVVASPIEIANRFNKYFVNVISQLLSSKPQSQKRTISMHGNVNKSIFLRPISAQEVQTLIGVVGKKRSAGADDIPGNILKEVSIFIAGPLAQIINESFCRGHFPRALKKTKILPLFKKGDRKNISNYRPIAILSVFSKIFEKAFCDRILSFIDKYDILNSNQHGFQRRKNTTTAMAGFIEAVLKARENNLHVSGVFYDFTKAFDTVDHELLLYKLNNMGISGVANAWIRSYLKDRKQIVSIKSEGSDYLSEEQTINVGLPQGSVIAPLMFILFTNDLPNEVTEGKLTLFADDTTHMIKSPNPEELYVETNTAVSQIEKWSRENNLFLNQEKTAVMRFQAKQERDASCTLIWMNKKSIVEESQAKLLGVIIDNDLNWRCHIDMLCKKIASSCFLIKKLMSVISPDLVRMVYFSHIQSILGYGIALWGWSPHIKRLFKLQKRAVRYMVKASRDPCAEFYFKDSCVTFFKKLDILCLPCLYIYSAINYLIDNCSNIQKTDAAHNHDLRNKKDIRLTTHKIVKWSRGPNEMGAKLYNKLPATIKCKDGMAFKNALKAYLLDYCFYSVDAFLSNQTD